MRTAPRTARAPAPEPQVLDHDHASTYDARSRCNDLSGDPDEVPPPPALAALAAAVLLAACASARQPLQGEFNRFPPSEGVDAIAPAPWCAGAPHRAGRTEAQQHMLRDVSPRLDVYGRPYWAEDDTGGRSSPAAPASTTRQCSRESRSHLPGLNDVLRKSPYRRLDYRFPRVAPTSSTCGRCAARQRGDAGPAPWPCGGGLVMEAVHGS